VTWASYNNEGLRNRFKQSMVAGAMAGRERVYPELVRMFVERPIVGYSPMANKYVLGGRLPEQHYTRRDAHNLMLEVMTSTGIAGLIPFTVVLGLVWRAAWRARRGPDGILPLAMLVGVLTANLSGNWIAAPCCGSPSPTRSRANGHPAGWLRSSTPVCSGAAAPSALRDSGARRNRPGSMKRCRAVLITFSGLDGAGKSTLIEWLRGHARATESPVAVFHITIMWVPTRTCGRCGNRWFGGPPAARTPMATRVAQRRGQSTGAHLAPPHRHRLEQATAALALFFDLVVFWCYRLRIETAHGGS